MAAIDVPGNRLFFTTPISRRGAASGAGDGVKVQGIKRGAVVQHTGSPNKPLPAHFFANRRSLGQPPGAMIDTSFHSLSATSKESNSVNVTGFLPCITPRSEL